MENWRRRYVGWLLQILTLCALSPLRVVEGAELACTTGQISGNYTVSNDLTCPDQVTFEVADGMDVIVSVVVTSTISKLRFEIVAGGSLTFSGVGNFTLANNDAPLSPSSGYEGGAIWNNGTVSFASAATFAGNSADFGGAIFNYDSGTISFGSAATFTSNTVGVSGGAINNYGNISFASAATFQGNSAYYGGAIFNYDSGTISFLSAATFTSNSAEYGEGGAIDNGAVYFNSSASILFASTATFTGNTATGSGNAVYNSVYGDVAFCLSPDGTDSVQENFFGTVITSTPSACPTSSTSIVPTVSPASVTGAPTLAPAPDVTSSSSGPSVGLIAGISAGGVALLVGIALWCRPKYKSACLGTLFKQSSSPPTTYDKDVYSNQTVSTTYGKDVYSNQAAPIGIVNKIDEEAPHKHHNPEGIQVAPSSHEKEMKSATLLQHVDTTVIPSEEPVQAQKTREAEGVEVDDAAVVSPQKNNAGHHQRPVIVEAGLMAFAAVGAVASHIPWVEDIYGLCDEIVKLLEANERTSRNHAEVVSWIRQMQATLNSVSNAIGSCADDATRVNEALAGRALSTLSHVKDTMEQYARRNMLAQFLLSRKLQADLQEAGKYFLEAIQALQLGLSAQQLQLTTQQLQVTTQQLQVTAQHFEATNKLLSISMKIDDDLSDIMSVVKNNEVMLAKVILQLAAKFPSLRDGDMFKDGSEASTASITPNNSHSRKTLGSEMSVSSIPDLEHVSRDFIVSLHNGKASKSVPVEAVVEALERLHIAPGDIIKLDDYPVGQGGFSKVYRVKVGEQIAAAKVVDLGALSTHQLQSVYKRFAKELYILSLLKSPYVVTIVGASATLDELALITEFMPRGSLRKVMDDPEEWSKFSISMSLTLLLDVARGMLYLEEQGVRHRDLKSHNILVTADNHAKLIDFGLSKTCDAVTKSTETSAKGAGGGTLPWTAPELFDMSDDGSPHQGSVKSDVYSFGVVIWEILAGPKSRPWGGIPVGTLINSVLRGRKPPLPTNALQYQYLELHQLMNDCMELDPSDRPTFADVCTQLTQMEESRAHG